MPEKSINLYTAILTTVSTLLLGAVTIMGGVIFNDLRADISENKEDIRVVSHRVTSVEFTAAETKRDVKMHDKQIDGLLELFGNTPTFRRNRE